MRVSTIGGDVNAIEGFIYECCIRDLNGKIEEFTAQGLDKVTGPLDNLLSTEEIRKMFPDYDGSCKLSVTRPMDFMTIKSQLAAGESYES